MARTKQTARKAPIDQPVVVVESVNGNNKNNTGGEREEAEESSQTLKRQKAHDVVVPQHNGLFAGGGHAAALRDGVDECNKSFPSAARQRLSKVVKYLKEEASNMLHYVKICFDYRMHEGKETCSAVRCLLCVGFEGEIQVLAIMKQRKESQFWVNCNEAQLKNHVVEDTPIRITDDGYSFSVPSEGVCYTRWINNIEYGNVTSPEHWKYC